MSTLDKQLEGFNYLSKQLEALSEKVRGKALRNAVSGAMTQVLKEARQAAPIGERAYHRTYRGRLVARGYLSRSIRKVSFKSKNGLYATASVGTTKEAFYGAQFIERGFRSAPARPWLGPVFERNIEPVLGKLSDNIEKNIDKAIKAK